MDYKMIHTCIRVLDLEASEAFYRKACGFMISRKKDFSEHGFTLSYMVSPGSPFELELTCNHGRQEPYEMGNGYSHLAVGVEDLEGSHKSHKELGLSPGDIKGLGTGGKGMFYFLKDPDGYMVEVVRSSAL